MRRTLAHIAGLALIASITHPAKADPITASVTLTVEPNDMPMSGIPYVYTGTIADLTAPPSDIGLTGTTIGYPGSFWSAPMQTGIQTTFNMTITLEGAPGSQPSIDVTGTVTGSYAISVIPQSSPYYADGYNYTNSLSVQGTATSATLEGWTPQSGIPMSLLSQYLNPAIYSFSEQGSGGMGKASVYLPPELPAYLEITASAAAEAPEPAAVLVYVAAIAAWAVRRGALSWRSRTFR